MTRFLLDPADLCQLNLRPAIRILILISDIFFRPIWN
jgi:hypothetical protein